MRNLLLFLIFSSFNSVILNAQHIVYHEGFDNGMPLGYKTYDIDGLTQYPGAFYLNFLGKAWVESNGRAVSTSYYSPPGTSNDWMISLPISIPDIGSGEKIMLAWQELSPDYNYRDSYRVLISEKDQEINSFIDIIYNSPSTVTTDFLRYVTVDLSAYANKTIYLAFQNNSEDKYLLYIDNITIVKSPQFGLGAINLENLVYNKANSLVDVRGNILNMGWDTLRSFKFTYQLDNDPPQQSIVSNLNFSPFTGESYSGNARLSVPYGKHKLSFWGTDINGTSNISDTSTMTIFGYGEKDYVPRNLMLEQFTSSSCQACNTGNNILKSLTGNLETKPIIIKYPQDFPLGGDPYCTKETYNRRIYYNVKSIPCSILDGNTLEINPGSLTQELILGSADREALVKFNFKYIIDVPNHSIHVFGTYRPTVDLVEGTRLMVGIKEKLSYKNIGIN
ncbi:MAG TPA: choice-of-anchor J domain-containing protein, partial [Saprospiraceae bacterium]|nr:choice-of-anchor J domain-containing protein [Saprospiraceae bacterium]